MSAIRKLAGQTAIYGMSSIIGRIVVWGLTPIYTAMLEPGEYGIFSDLYSFVTYFLVVLTFGMETAFFRFSSDDKQNLKPYTQALMFVTGLALVIQLLLTIGNTPFANWLGYGDRPSLVMMMNWIIFLDVVTSLPMAKLRFDERPIAFATVSLFSIFVNISLNIIFILIMKKTSVEYVFIANLISSGLKFAVLLFLSSPLSKQLAGFGKFGKKLSGVVLFPSKLEFDKPLMINMASFGLYIMIAGLFGMINQNSDVNFISRIWGKVAADYNGIMLTGTEMAGIFSANKKLAVFILLVTQAFRYAAEPFFFRHAKETNSRAVFAKVFHYFMLASLMTFLLISSFAYEFVSTKFFGFQLISERYWSGLTVVPPLLFSFVLWGAYTNLSIWFKLTKQVRFGILFSAIGVILLVIFDFILIPFYGYLGATIAMLISYASMTFLVYISGQKYYPIPYKIGRLSVYAVILLAAYWINETIGRAEHLDSTFFSKLLVSFAAIGICIAMEKFLPVPWKDQLEKKESTKK